MKMFVEPPAIYLHKAPVDYLMMLFEQLPLLNDGDDIDPLLPWNIQDGLTDNVKLTHLND